jgi:trehalose 6-phosphate phosphatase
VKYILAKENVDLLAQLAWSRVILAFDFDGTLAPIVEERGAAQMRAKTRSLFARLCSLSPCAVISGRSERDVSARLRGMSVKYIVGNHGLEPGTRLPVFEAAIERITPVLRAALAGSIGVDVEDKRYSLALHYRRARNKRDARTAILRAVAELPEAMRIIPGKLVVNVVPFHAPNKGEALLRLRALEGADTALYVGDDVTDEDVFTIDQPGRLFTIRIGMSNSSAAAYYLRQQRDIDALLARMVLHREHRAAQ